MTRFAKYCIKYKYKYLLLIAQVLERCAKVQDPGLARLLLDLRGLAGWAGSAA